MQMPNRYLPRLTQILCSSHFVKLEQQSLSICLAQKVIMVVAWSDDADMVWGLDALCNIHSQDVFPKHNSAKGFWRNTPST